MQNRTIFALDDEKEVLSLYESLFAPKKRGSLDFFYKLSGEKEVAYSEISVFEDANNYLESMQKYYDTGKRVPLSIIDMRLTKANGLEIAKRVRKIDDAMIIILVTAFSDYSVHELIEHLGHDIYYIRKPFNPEELFALVRSSLKQWNAIQKTKELEKLLLEVNRNLENRVEEEMIKNREKDMALLQSAKYAVMGEMIAMIAHQWRQPITGIGIIADNLMLDIEMGGVDEERFQKNLLSISTQVKYLSSTIDDFRNFFKPNKQRELSSVGACIQKAIDILEKSLISHGIEIEKSCTDRESIFLYKNELIQVFINIIKNADDAILENGVKNPKIAIKSLDTEGGVEVSIQDNGGGIQEDTIQQIFEPYFSTKIDKNGTGLGLYMAKIIINEHHCGWVRAENCDGGALFRMFIPKMCKTNINQCAEV